LGLRHPPAASPLAYPLLDSRGSVSDGQGGDSAVFSLLVTCPRVNKGLRFCPHAYAWRLNGRQQIRFGPVTMHSMLECRSISFPLRSLRLCAKCVGFSFVYSQFRRSLTPELEVSWGHPDSVGSFRNFWSWFECQAISRSRTTFRTAGLRPVGRETSGTTGARIPPDTCATQYSYGRRRWGETCASPDISSAIPRDSWSGRRSNPVDRSR
jgi:hypothetical protein